MHVGKTCEDFKCQKLSVDAWDEDSYVGDVGIKEKEEEKYLGEILSNNGRNLKNVKARVKQQQLS